MADTLNTLKTRRSCRAYTSEHVEEEKLNAIIEAGTYATTGMGKQSPIILVIKDPAVHEQLRKLNAAAMGMDIDPFYGAPDLLVVLANKDIPTYIYDGSLVMGNSCCRSWRGQLLGAPRQGRIPVRGRKVYSQKAGYRRQL